MRVIEAGLSNPYLGPIYALVAGILTSASPCTLAAVPLVIGHVASGTKGSRVKDLGLFFAGMALSLSAVGMVAGVLGRSLILSAPWIRPLAGFGFLFGGLVYMGIVGNSKTCAVRLPTGPWGSKENPAARGLASLGMGALYGLSASPCSTPALFAILGLVATTGSVARGGLLLLSYSLGQSFLVGAAGLATSGLKGFLEKERNLNALEYLRKAGGLVIALLGLYLLLRPYI